MRFLEGHRGDVMSLAFAPAGDRLATAGWDGTVRLWEAAGGETVRIVHTPNEHAAAVLRPDGGAVAAACSEFGEGLFAWDVIGDWFFRKPYLLRFPGDRCWGLAYSPDGQTLAGAFDSGRVVWWRPGEKLADHRTEH